MVYILDNDPHYCREQGWLTSGLFHLKILFLILFEVFAQSLLGLAPIVLPLFERS